MPPTISVRSNLAQQARLYLKDENIRFRALQALQELCGLTQGQMLLKSSTASSTRVSFQRIDTGDWPVYPRRGKSLADGLEIIDRHLGRPGEAPFAAAATPWNPPAACWIALEWDAELPEGEVFSEDHLMAQLDEQAVALIRQSGLEIHWMLSGNRSVHLHLFLRSPVGRELAMELVRLLPCLLPRLKVDASNLDHPMRLPLSVHHKTGQLARYSGCRTAQDVSQYILAIEPCGGEREVRAAIKALTVEEVTEKRTRSTKEQRATSRSSGHTAVGNSSKRNVRFAEAFSIIPFLENHPRRGELLELITGGIPVGSFNSVIKGGDIMTAALIALGGREEALEALSEVAAIGIEDNPKELKSRIKRLRSSMKKFWAGFVECGGGAWLSPDKAQKHWPRAAALARIIRTELRQLGLDTREVNATASTALHCLVRCEMFGTAVLGVEDIASKLVRSPKTISKHLKTLREQLPILKIKTEYCHDAGLAREYTIDEDYANALLSSHTNASLNTPVPSTHRVSGIR